MSNKIAIKQLEEENILLQVFLQPLKEEPDVGNMKSLVEKLEKLKLKNGVPWKLSNSFAII